MKNLILLGLGIFLWNCSSPHSLEKSKAENFDDLAGKWIRTNNQPGQITYESWKKINSEKYQGFSYRMENQDTLWQEKILLHKERGSWYFDVWGKGETAPTRFTLTEIKPHFFLAENPENEFPKSISYTWNEKEIHAIVSDGKITIEFYFQKN
jgi:hypothetical protein